MSREKRKSYFVEGNLLFRRRKKYSVLKDHGFEGTLLTYRSISITLSHPLVNILIEWLILMIMRNNTTLQPFDGNFKLYSIHKWWWIKQRFSTLPQGFCYIMSYVCNCDVKQQVKIIVPERVTDGFWHHEEFLLSCKNQFVAKHITKIWLKQKAIFLTIYELPLSMLEKLTSV